MGGPALKEACRLAGDAPRNLFTVVDSNTGVAMPSQPCQSSVLYAYSERLSCLSPPNAFSKLIQAKREAGIPLIDLTVSNPTEVIPDYPHAAIRDAYASIRNLSYRPHPAGLKEARGAIAGYYAGRGQHVPLDRILLTASTSEAYALLFKLFCNPDDEVLVPVPSYPLFDYLARFECVRIIPYRLWYEGRWFIDLDDFHRKITPRTRAIVIVNPNNPTGSFLKNWQAEKLFQVAKERSLPIISDEVFSDYSFQNESDSVTTLVGSGAPPLGFSLNGLSKSACMPQVKLAWMVIQGGEAEAAIARERLELLLDTYLSVATAVQLILPELLEIGSKMRCELTRRAKRNVQILRDVLTNSPAHPLHVEAGWSAIVQLPRNLAEEEWITRLIQDFGVIVQPGYFFDLPSEAFVVVSLITPAEEFTEGIARVRELATRC